MKKVLLAMLLVLNLYATSQISIVYDDSWKNVDIYPQNGATAVNENEEDWVGIYPQGTSNDGDNVISWAWVRNLGTWNDEEREVKTFNFDALPSGDYEVRYFLNNSFDTYASQSFSVGENSTTSDISMVYDDDWKNIDIYPINGATSVNENYEDWVGIYRQGESSNSDNVLRRAWVRDLYVWHDDQGRDIKAFDFDALPAGNYEVRYFLNNSFDTYRSQSFNIDGNVGDNPQAPYNAEKFRHVLDISKLQYPESSPAAVDYGEFEGVYTDYFYLSNGYMVFNINNSEYTGNEKKGHVKGDDYIRRAELRQGPTSNSTWSVSTQEEKRVSATLNLPSSNELHEYTWMQIHDYEGYNKPLIRLVWRSSKAGYEDYLWAALKTNNTGDDITWVPLMQRLDADFNAEIIVYDNKLTVKLNGTPVDDLNERNVGYWDNGHNNYFKAGVYISGDNTDRSPNYNVNPQDRNIQVKFKELDFSI